MVTAHGLTLEEYFGLPEEKPYREYVNGEVVPKLAPQRRHVALAEELLSALREYRRREGGFSGPEAAVLFDVPGDRRVLLPEVAYYWAPGKPQGGELMWSPTLAIEIRSPGQALSVLREKCAYYVAHGVDVAWLVDAQSRAVEAFEPAGTVVVREGGVLSSAPLPGLSVDVTALFAAAEPLG